MNPNQANHPFKIERDGYKHKVLLERYIVRLIDEIEKNHFTNKIELKEVI
jgi:hypothetical protein